jgi:hypothetical protein
MPPVLLGTSSYRRRGARTPEISLINMLLERDPTNQVDGLVRFQRPGLKRFATIGDGPIRGIYRKLGVLSSLYWAVSGQELYKLTEASTPTLVGAIPGNDICSMDGSATRLIVVAEGIAYSTDGTTITTVNMPNSELVSCVLFIDGYFLLAVKNSHRIYWLAPGDVDPDALNFFSAEKATDNIVGMARAFDEVWIFKQQTTEVFTLTGNVDAPFQPIPGRMYEKGCANRDTISVVDNTIFWVSNEFIAYRADTSPVRISDHSLEERLRNAGAVDMRAFTFTFDGHTLYVIRAAYIGTYYYDVENKNIGRFKTYDHETWRAHLGTQVSGTKVVMGDDSEGILWRFDPEISNDNGVVLEREIVGGLPLVGAPQSNRNFTIFTTTGWAPITGTATNPKVFMCFSDDGGNLFTSWFEEHLGEQGKYKTIVNWAQLGQMRAPGRIYRLRMTDDAIFRISFARANEPIAT